MNHSLKIIIAASALSLLAACGNNSSGTDATSAGKGTEPTASAVISVATAVNAYRPDTVVTESPLKPRDLTLTITPTNIALGTPEASQVDAARKNNETAAADNMGKPLQIGFGREVAQTATASATKQVLKWQATKSGGQVAAINFSSTGAKGMRLGLLVTQLPPTATLRFYAKGATTAFEVKGADVLAVLAKNLSSGDKTEEGRTYWGPDINGADAVMEIEIPTGVAASSVVVSIPNISHIFMSGKEISKVTSQINYIGDTNAGLTCQVDVTCSSPKPAATDAVVHLRFTKNAGFTSLCSGTMLNDSINSSTNYLLSANHCISTQTVASTLTSWFKYRSSTCDDGTTGEYYPTVGGADLLYTAYNTDSTLLKLRNPPSVSGVLYAGWDAINAPLISTAVHTIHHPRGDQQRFSKGSITGYSIRETDTTRAYYDTTFWNSNITNGTILDVTLTTGLTEGGSSGSGLFKGTEANPILIGQLFGGSTPGNVNPNDPLDPKNYTPACTVADPKIAMQPNNVYGRFDVAFNAGMSDWLNQGVKTVTQFYNAASGIHYYAFGLTDKSNFATSNPSFANQGTSFNVSSYQTAGLSPVYRFYNTSNGTYFFTISEKERAAVASNTPRMRYDGVVWYASATLTGANSLTVYSAFNATTGSQYFTTDFAKRAGPTSQFKADGIAFYVAP